jgi:hypothetical protein
MNLLPASPCSCSEPSRWSGEAHRSRLGSEAAAVNKGRLPGGGREAWLPPLKMGLEWGFSSSSEGDYLGSQSRAWGVQALGLHPVDQEVGSVNVVI